MSVIYNGTTVGTILYSGVDITKGYYGSTEVFSKNQSVVLYNGFMLDTGISRVPEPYDENGYNFNGTAPEKRDEKTVVLDVTDYSSVNFDWDNDGSGSFWGTLWGKLELYQNGSLIDTITLFDGARYASGTKIIDVSNITGNVTFLFRVYAWSQSSYGGYTTHATLNVGDIIGNI